MCTSTVIIPTYNRPEHLAGVLDALALQAEPDAPFAVVVVDDGSTPPARLPDREWPFSLYVVRLPENRGRAAARNAALAHVETPLVIFLDDDMRPQPGFVRAYAEAMASRTRTVGLGSVAFRPDIPRDRLTVYLETRGIAKLGASDPIPFKYFLTYNSAAPTDLLRAAGGFDERLRTWGGEDLELAWRLAKAGAEFVRVPDARAYHAHRRTLEGLLEVSEAFARRSLPLILETHRELIPLLRADVFGPKRYAAQSESTRASSWRRRAVRALTHAPFPGIVRLPISAWPGGPWPMRLFDYLIVSAWRKGLDGAKSLAEGAS